MAEAVSDEPKKVGSSRFINSLIAEFGMRTYLEVGVQNGHTFTNVEVAHKEAVDPHFRFDWAALASDGTRFFEEPSDTYFARFPAEKRERFDLIFLDGLHTFEQTLRDLLNTLETSHPRTIWLIDDTVPSDPFSISQDQQEAVALRKLAGTSTIKPNIWQGDVFKLVFAIHDFLPALSFATIGRRKLQTIAWKERRRDLAPRFNSLETITRMTFLDYLKHRDVMNLQPVDGIFDRIRQGWARDGI